MVALRYAVLAPASGNSTAGKLSARSVSEVNIATGAYDVRYGNALAGVVDVRLKEGGEKLGILIGTMNLRSTVMCTPW